MSAIILALGGAPACLNWWVPDARVDLGIPEDIERALRHLGVITSLSNAIDLRMLQWGTWLESSANPDELRLAWAKRAASAKRQKIAGLLHPGWLHGEKLIDRIRRCFDYRNGIAHATPRFRFEPSKRNPVWEWEAVGRKGAATAVPIDFGGFAAWEMRFDVIEQCLAWLVSPGISMVSEGVLDLALLDLRFQTLEIGRTPWRGIDVVPDQWADAVVWLFD